MKKWHFVTYRHHLEGFQSHLQHTVSFLDKFNKKKIGIFTKISKLFFFIPIIVPMLLIGHNTKKKYWPKSPQLKKIPKMPKNANFGAYFDHFLSFWWPSLRGELRGYSFVFWYVSLLNMKKYNIFSAGKHWTPCLDYFQTPSNASRSSGGWWKPKFCLTFVAKYCICVPVTVIKLVSHIVQW